MSFAHVLLVLSLPVVPPTVPPARSARPQPSAERAAATSIAHERQISQAVTVDHGAFDALLRVHVVRGMVNYDAFAKAPEFQRYLAKLAATDPATLPRNEQLAFWINAYNAYTIQLINSHQERESIRNINKSIGFVKAYGPWKEKLAVVGRKAYGLDEIEQDIIRPRYKEPRIHFALVCAAMGCPPLRSEAYVGDRLEAQLEEQARTFLLQSPEKNRVDVAARTIYVSPIFVEFRDYIQDFGGSKASVGAFIAKYYPAGAQRDLLLSGSYTVKVTNYDWTLNSQANAARR
jgi:Protein of unknown function, DUF547